MQHSLVQLATHAVLLTLLTFAAAWQTDQVPTLLQKLLLWQFWFLPFGIGLGGLTWAWTLLAWVTIIRKEPPAVQPSKLSIAIDNLLESRWLFPFLAVPAFGEELLYRGFIQSRLCQMLADSEVRHPTILGIALTGLLFGIWHRDYSGRRWTRQHLARTFGLGVAAIGWGTAAQITGSLWPAILAHGTQGFIAGYRSYRNRMNELKETEQ